jgi:amino acid permease
MSNLSLQKQASDDLPEKPAVNVSADLEDADGRSEQLQRSLKNRHAQMISYALISPSWYI